MLQRLQRRLRSVATHIASTNRRRLANGQRGAVLVEAAIALPTVTLLMFGILEYGLLFGDGMDLASAMRAGSRTGAAMTATSATSDYLILQQVKTTSGRVAPQIQRIVVYKAIATGGAPSDACKQGHATLGICNVYSQDDMNMSRESLENSGHSSSWSPDSRIPGTDYIGVWAEVDHKWVTGLMGSGRTVADNAVMRVQPLPEDGSTNDSGYWPLPIATTVPTTMPPTTTTTKVVATTTTVKKTTTSTIPTTTTAAATTSTTKVTGPTTTTTAKPTTTTVKKTTTTTTPPSNPPPPF